MKVDAIVNSANPDPIFVQGTDYAIYMAAGPEELLKERKNYEKKSEKLEGVKQNILKHTSLMLNILFTQLGLNGKLEMKVNLLF